MPTNAPTEYDVQAAEFLKRFGLSFHAQLMEPQRCPDWNDGKSPPGCGRCGRIHGYGYVVTIARGELRRGYGEPLATTGAALTFDYWQSAADSYPERYGKARAAFKRTKRPTAYDVLACLSGDHQYTDPDEVIAEFGIESLGKRPIERAQAIAAHARRVAAFFTAEELAALDEIR